MIPTNASLSSELRDSLQKLESIISQCKSMVVAYSGGVDSGLLAYLSQEILGHSMIAVLGISPSLPTREKDRAIRFLEKHAIPYETVETHELENESYRMNLPRRCYFCKSELFGELKAIATRKNFQRIAYGANADDSLDYRPGHEAASENEVIAPLVDAKIGKREVRQIARALSLELWDKPASPCLASRIPYYSEVSAEKLKQIEEAEDTLLSEGFKSCRVRHHGDIARIEIPKQDMGRMFDGEVHKRVTEKIRKAGFSYVTLDLEGFESGKLNRVIRTERKK